MDTRNTLFLFFIILANQISFGQYQYDFKNYKPLKSSGEIPNAFITSIKEKYNKDLQDQPSGNPLSKDKKKATENFLLGSNYSTERLMLSGRLLYGDPITTYINKVAAEVLKDDPELLGKLQFYTFKMNPVNAAVTNGGVIFINLGLIAYLQTEAELAFFLSHEIAHYQQKHHIKGAMEKYEILKGKGNYSRKTYDEKLDMLFQCSKQNEFEADSIGALRFLTMQYRSDCLPKAFDMLHYSYLPYDQIPFNKSFLNASPLVIPHVFFKDSVSPISEIEQYDDTFLTHPHIDKRKSKVSLIVEDKPSLGNEDFIVSQEEFLFVRELARFEIVRLGLLSRNYGDAIYNAFLLSEKYPDNEYLEASVAKALYGLAKYKNADEYHRAAKSFQRAEGESQQLHYLLRQLDTKQLNVVALKYIRTTKKKYPGNTVLASMEKDIIEDMVVINEMKFEDFYANIPEVTEVIDQETKQNHRPSTLQKKFENFYLSAFVDDINDEDLKQEFLLNYPKLEKKKKEAAMTYNEKQKIEADRLKKIKKEGPKMLVKKIIVLDPNVFIYSKDKIFPIDAEKRKEELGNVIREEAEKLSMRASYINWKTLQNSSEKTYNDYSSFNEWMQDRYNHGEIFLVSIFNDELNNLMEQYDTQYACNVSVYYNKSLNTHYYEFEVFNLRSGKKEYRHFISKKGDPTASRIKNYLNKDISFIQK